LRYSGECCPTDAAIWQHPDVIAQELSPDPQRFASEGLGFFQLVTEDLGFAELVEGGRDRQVLVTES